MHPLAGQGLNMTIRDIKVLSDLIDNGDNLDDVVTIDLPFNFTFYGVEYDKISIKMDIANTDLEKYI